MRGTWNRCAYATAACLIAATVFTIPAAFAIVPPDQNEALRQKTLYHPDLHYRNVFVPIAGLGTNLSAQLAADLSSLGVDPGNAYFDRRTGRWGTLVLTQPLIPGTGSGNDLEWSALGMAAPQDNEALERAVWQAFETWLLDHAVALGFDPTEFGEPRVSVVNDHLIHVSVGRVVDGVPVRRTLITAAINSGNLVLTGARNWGQVAVSTTPRLAAEDAEQVLRGYLDGFEVAGLREPARLELVPVSDQDDESRITIGQGVDYRLVWVLQPDLGGTESWEALVDAHSGEVLSFQDLNDYLSRRVEGGIFPVSNDGQGDDGTLQFGFPMPFADISLDGSPVGFTTTGGNLPPGTDAGTISTALSGPFININDNCGAIDESVAAGDLDLDGVALPGTNCDVPAGHSAGDTNAARSGFYELNRLKEQALGYMPTDPWLNDQLTANMNINQVCNAFWSNTTFTVNFYRNGIAPNPDFECRNTGEIAAIFDHEWGHGWDRMTGVQAISRPGEGIADIFAQNRLNTSCIGRGFWISNNGPTSPNCSGYGDPCLDCDGVRDTDWAKRQSGMPHTVAWADANCPSGTGTPCGGATHCEGSIVSESAWDYVHRDLMGFEGSPFNLDLNTALELGTRLAYHGSGNVVDWYQCVTDGTGGCNADSGYLGWLAADDDDGDLTNGTPHMSAIFAAFDRHQIACPSPVPQNSGCAGAPTDAPTNLATTAFDEGMELTWDPVPDAVEYQIFRTEGINGCDFGKALVGTTTGTSFTETGLRNGFEVLYSVMAVGANSACTSPMSVCQSVIPVAGPSGTLTGTVTNSVTTDPIQGVTIEAAGPVTLGGVTLSDGTYTISAPVGTYDITASMDGFFPQTETGVAVTEGETVVTDFALEPLPQTIDVSPSSFTFEVFEAQSDSDTLNVGNLGNIDLTWDIGETETDCATQTDVGWLSADPASGVTPPFDNLEATVTVDSIGLPAGVHQASLCVNSDDPDTPVVEVPVTLTVVAAPAIQVAPEEIVVSVEAGTTQDETLTVSNLGSIDLDWAIVQEALRRGLNAPLTGYRPVTDGAPRSGLVLAPVDGAADAALDPELAAAAEAGIELSEPLPADQRPRARGTSPNDVLQDGALIVPNTTAGFIVALDPETGDVIDPALIDISGNTSGARREALLHPDGERVLMTSQTNDVVHAFSVEDGSYLGVFAPAGGADTSIINNVRGMDFHPVTGNLLVTSSDSPAQDRVVEFDLEGNFVRVFIDSAPQGGLSPWDMLVRESDILLTDSGDGTRRYDFDGNFLGDFETITNFPEQIAFAANGNILISSLFGDLYEFAPDGTLVAQYLDTVTSVAGVYELPNLNFVLSGSISGTGQGIQELDRTNTLVRNILDGTSYQINFAQSLDCTFPSWLTVDPTSGSTGPGGSTDVTVTIDTELLGLGEHTASICFESNDPIEPLLVVPVTLTVTGDVPMADISPTSFDVDLPLGGTTTEVLNIGNVGQLDLLWDIGEADAAAGCESPSDVGWLSANPTSGTTAPSASIPVDVGIDTAGLSAGVYEALLCVSTNDGDNLLVPIPVTLTVLGAVAEITPDSFTFEVLEGGTDEGTMNIASTGTADLTWSIADSDAGCATPSDAAWLSANPTSGTTPPGSSADVAVAVDSAGLAPGVYDGTLCVTTNVPGGELEEVPVMLTVNTSPVIDVVPESLSVTLETDSTTVEPVDIHNLGSATLDWTIPTDPAFGIGASEPLIGFTFKTSGATSPDPQNWTRISTDGGSVPNAPDDTGAPTDVTFTWGELSGSLIFLGTSTLADDAVPQYDYDLQGMNGYGFGSGARYFIELSGLDPNTPYEYWFVAYRSTSAIENVVEVSDGDVPGAIVFNQSISSGDNNGRFIINDQVSSDTQQWNDLSFATTSSSTGTIRIEWEGDGQTTVIGAFAIRPLLNCALPSWLSIAPTAGSIAPGGPPDTVSVTLDSTGLGLGTHDDSFCVESNDPLQPKVGVPVSLTVTLPGDEAVVEGTVQSLGYCGADPSGLEGATVEIVGAQNTATVTTDENGFYRAFVNEIESPIDINVTAAGHLPASVEDIAFAGGDTVVQDFDLTLDAPCGTADPGSFSFALAEGGTRSDTLTIGNVAGGAALTWTINEAETTGLVDPRGHFPIAPRFVEHKSADGVSAGADPAAGAASGAPAGNAGQGGFTVPAYTTTGFNVVGYVNFDATVPGALTVVNADQPTNIYAQTFIDNDFSKSYWLASADGDQPIDTFGTMDTATGAFTALGTVTGGTADGTWTSMKWDHSSRTLYANNFESATGNALFTIDPDTLQATEVGVISGTGVNPDAIVISIAISPEGQMYGIDITDDVLLAIDKTTAEAAVIGPLGVTNARFAQDMDFDQTTGTLYWAGYQGGGDSQMFTIDTATGTATSLGDVQGGSELLSFAIALPGAAVDCDNPVDVPWLSVFPTGGTTAAGSASDVQVSVDSTGLAAGEYSAGLCLATNDSAAAVIVIPVDLAVVDDVPIADVTPSSFSFTVAQGGFDGDTLNMGNFGAVDLVWSLEEAESPGLQLGHEFFEDFDSYDVGTDMHGQGGWKGWDNDSTLGALVSDAQSTSAPHSVAIAGTSDLVHEFSDANNGQWTVTAQQYVPSDFSGETFFILLNTYADGGTKNWSTQVTFDSATNEVVNGGPAGGTLPLVTGQWVEIRVEIDFGADTQTFFYNGEQLFTGSWTDGLSGDGELRLQAIDLFADGASTVYYDDISAVGPPPPADCVAPSDVAWLSTSPASGTTPSLSTVPVTVSVDTTGLTPGDYSALLCATTNDSNAALVEIPVDLTVADAEFVPAALVVDTDGTASDDNGVFEPGESVDAAPSWTNIGVESAPLTGTATNFTGPAGADYTIDSASADYGEAAGGATASCLDTGTCYDLSVTDPATRPAPHWDAVLDEQVSGGSAHSWTLHIGESFDDVPSTGLFYSWVETLFHNGVTTGCVAGQYCPSSENTRAQMAIFLLRSVEGGDYVPEACEEDNERFDDVPATSPFCPWIEELANRGVTSGCGGDNYCPASPVSRAEMAVFLLRALEGASYQPPECNGVFTDVTCPSTFANWIEDLVARGITVGCGNDNYCPTDAVTRGQMAVFLSRTFDLVLYGP